MRLIVFLFILVAGTAAAQSPTLLGPVIRHTASRTLTAKDSSYRFLTVQPENEIHYLYPLYQALGREEYFRKQMGEKNLYAAMAQYFTMIGDYRSSLEYDFKTYDKLPPQAVEQIQQISNGLTKVQYMDALSYIVGMALGTPVVMINEAADKPFHRVFTMSLLEPLREQGYKYLAMESLNNHRSKSLNSVNRNTGYYTSDPMTGELIRKALSLGFELVSYEDTMALAHNSRQRDSSQAAHLYDVFKKDKDAKMIVLAGFGHVSEKVLGDDHIPMALAFKTISGIDPFTVDQAFFTEGSTQEYGRVLYDKLMEKLKITESVVLMQNRKPLSLIENSGYDLNIIHPPTVYKNNRPSWLTIDGARKAVSITPQDKNLFLVQAYYENEYNSGKLQDLVPADQTYVSAEYGYYELYLHPGKYRIVTRDVGYNVLAVREKTVE